MFSRWEGSGTDKDAHRRRRTTAVRRSCSSFGCQVVVSQHQHARLPWLRRKIRAFSQRYVSGRYLSALHLYLCSKRGEERRGRNTRALARPPPRPRFHSRVVSSPLHRPLPFLTFCFLPAISCMPCGDGGPGCAWGGRGGARQGATES
eukprot:scaffold8634_cov115-Isochrysis_galbana.AAC.12